MPESVKFAAGRLPLALPGPGPGPAPGKKYEKFGKAAVGRCCGGEVRGWRLWWVGR